MWWLFTKVMTRRTFQSKVPHKAAFLLLLQKIQFTINLFSIGFVSCCFGQNRSNKQYGYNTYMTKYLISLPNWCHMWLISKNGFIIPMIWSMTIGHVKMRNEAEIKVHRQNSSWFLGKELLGEIYSDQLPLGGTWC